MISEDMVRVAGVATPGSDAERDATRTGGKNQTPISKRTGTDGATRASTVVSRTSWWGEEKEKKGTSPSMAGVEALVPGERRFATEGERERGSAWVCGGCWVRMGSEVNNPCGLFCCYATRLSAQKERDLSMWSSIIS